MATLNKVMIMGNVTQDPELRYTENGKAVARFSIAVNYSYKKPQTTEWVKGVDFIPVTVFDRQAENVSKYVRKGSLVFVEGKLRRSTWTTDGGAKHSRLDIAVNKIQFLFKIPKDASGVLGASGPESTSRADNILPREETEEGNKENVPF